MTQERQEKKKPKALRWTRTYWATTRGAGSMPCLWGRKRFAVEQAFPIIRGLLEALIAESPSVDLSNHHNALLCPYCNPHGLTLAAPRSAPAGWPPTVPANREIREGDDSPR
jgi:hypothetical protein